MPRDQIYPTAIRLDGVARRFGQRWVLRGIDLEVAAGAVVALTGRNGSGKTTLLRIVATLLWPTRGSATVFGDDTVSAADAVRPRIGMLGHQSALYADLTAFENLSFSVRMAGQTADRAVLDDAIAKVGLESVRNERVRGFSAGMRRRLGVARLLLRPPSVLLLDEPYAAFDDEGIALINSVARSTAGAGGVVLIATHDMTRAAGTITQRVHIESGRLTQPVVEA